MFVVPNHLLEQFSREFMQLYPNAKLLVAAKEDLTKDRRKFLTAKIASGEWDGIIVTHSSFERIGMSQDYQEKFLLEQITLAEADAELPRLSLLKKNHLDEQYVARRNVRDLPGRITSLNERLTSLSADEATTAAHSDDPITIGKSTWPRDEAAAILANKLETLPAHVREPTRIPIGTYRGLRFGMILHPNFPAEVYLDGAITRTYGLSRDHQGPRAVLNAAERLATGYGSEIVRVRQDLSIAESQLRDYQA